ncbi:hypothetical protein PMAYCL1PPCAC_12018, partial [Pristionchus mayeri]
IKIVGDPLPNAAEFAVNLKASSDIAFHFNPRFDEHCVVRTYQRYNEWGSEEKYGREYRSVYRFPHIDTVTSPSTADRTSPSNSLLSEEKSKCSSMVVSSLDSLRGKTHSTSEPSRSWEMFTSTPSKSPTELFTQSRINQGILG